eukprot:TRINITY_DN3847_c0_g1_i2.p1 TRINITY_DN3847_c0_g1~~TRINITY_DN3847_c0_g1_i2.p1  ORF type:complete len:748 (-),score=123.62 TRINITY_DN3847_c0_g1_i2:81-2324(-)
MSKRPLLPTVGGSDAASADSDDHGFLHPSPASSSASTAVPERRPMAKRARIGGRAILSSEKNADVPAMPLEPLEAPAPPPQEAECEAAPKDEELVADASVDDAEAAADNQQSLQEAVEEYVIVLDEVDDGAEAEPASQVVAMTTDDGTSSIASEPELRRSRRIATRETRVAKKAHKSRPRVSEAASSSRARGRGGRGSGRGRAAGRGRAYANASGAVCPIVQPAFPPEPYSPPEASSSSAAAHVKRDGRFPDTQWALKMCMRLQQQLRDCSGGIFGRKLSLGTDCAGAEAPVYAILELSKALKEMGLSLELDHMFSCDVDKASQIFIQNNMPPRALFVDMLARTSAAGPGRRALSHCILTDRLRKVPDNLDVYVAGFPCKDFSMLNPTRPGLEGPHAKVFYAVVDYITRHRPKTFVLENVAGLAIQKHGQRSVDTVMETLRQIPGYDVMGWDTNTVHFCVPQNRKRIYIVGVNLEKVRLKVPLDEWAMLLKSLYRKLRFSVHDFMLDDEEPEVVGERARLQSRWRSAGAREEELEHDWQEEDDDEAASFPVVGAGSSSSHGVPKRQAALHRQGFGRLAASVQRRLYGYGQRWQHTHQRYRKAAKLGAAKPLTEGKHRGWTPYMAERQLDVLELVTARLNGRLARQGEPVHVPDTDYISEISRGLHYCSHMRGVVPTLTPSSCMWVYSRWRWLLGVERLALQGFPADSLNLDKLSESEIGKLAGNAMSVPVVGAFLLIILANVEFPDG